MTSTSRLLVLLGALAACLLGQGLAPLPSRAQEDAGEEPAGSAEEEAEPEEDPLVAEGERLQAQFEALTGRREEFERKIRRASGEDLRVLQEQNWQRKLEGHDTSRRLVENTPLNGGLFAHPSLCLT